MLSIVESTNKIRGRYDIRDLVGKMPKDYEPKEENWGAPIGLEVWQIPQYIPKKGDFVIVTFDPQSGHDQKGRRPALVVAIPKESSLIGYVMVEQVKSID